MLDKLKKENPVTPKGYLAAKHHQWFTPDFGHPKLKEHITSVTALMKAAPNWGTFKRLLERAFPKVIKPSSQKSPPERSKRLVNPVGLMGFFVGHCSFYKVGKMIRLHHYKSK